MNTLPLGIVVGLTVILSGCAEVFTRIPFEYSSATHLPPKQAFAKSSLPPEDVIYLMSENLRNANAEITYRGRSTQLPTMTPDADNCWAANNEIVRQEFLTFSANDFRAFQEIDRKAIFAQHNVSVGCSWVTMNKIDDPRVLLIEARLRSRSATASVPVTTVVQTFQMTHGNGTLGQFGSVPYTYSGQTNGFQIGTTDTTVQNTVDTVYDLWAWPTEDGGSILYAVALPESGGYVAKRGNSIGYLWWHQIDGTQEAGIVRDLFYRLDEEEHALHISAPH